MPSGFVKKIDPLEIWITPRNSLDLSVGETVNRQVAPLMSAVPIGVSISNFEVFWSFLEFPTMVPSLSRSLHLDVVGSVGSLFQAAALASMTSEEFVLLTGGSTSCVRKNVPSEKTNLMGSWRNSPIASFELSSSCTRAPLDIAKSTRPPVPD